jgi:NAD(P)-dependent dehydrogenase (short-subunit alcohol dehydrogenase family)
MNDSQKPLAGRYALVTGASKGIGRACAMALAEAGAHVIALARTIGALEELEGKLSAAGHECTMIPFDLLQLDHIDDLGAVILERFGRLDILVGNAAILGPLSPVGHIKASDWSRVMDLNLNANWRLMRIFDPLLKRSKAGRAVFLTSWMARNNLAYFGPYATSKAALEALVRCYAQELANTSVRINLLDPGVVRTDMRKEAFPGENPDDLPAPEELGPLFVEMCSPDFERNGETVRFRKDG